MRHTSPMGAAEGGDWQRGRIVSTSRPDRPPHYARPPRKVARTWRASDAIDAGFFVVATILVLWLVGVVALSELRLAWETAFYLVVFWVVLAYVGLPRLQEVLARIYVPDYFIGRAVTGAGLLGDPINLGVDGTRAQLDHAMTGAGWVKADDVTLRSSWGIIVSAVFRRSYPRAPVSPLLLFGEVQQVAYEKEVDGNASQRHHVRFWPVPEGFALPGGYRADWLAGATYVRAVGLSTFTFQVTHKVDADVDVERDFVVGTVTYAVPEATERVIDDFSTAFHSRNGGGDLVRSDGNLAVLDLRAVVAGEPPASAPPRLASRRLPPAGLLLSGVLGIVKAATTIAAVLLALGADADLSLLTQVHLVGAATLVIALWVATLARNEPARVLLMLVCGLDAVAHLVALNGEARPSLLVLASVAASVLILIAVSSTRSQRWVRAPGGRAERV